MSIRQGIIRKKSARKKNNQAKYSFIVNKTTSQKATNGTIFKKFAYTKKVLINGKYRYYYN